jgi:hypothetical protein
MTTKDMERALHRAIKKMGTYVCFEIGMPDNHERVDGLSYNTRGEWRFYELKLTMSDFKSQHAHTFRGHLNYYVIPKELLEKVKPFVPEHVGIYVVWQIKGYPDAFAECVKRAKKQELQVNHDDLFFSFMQALSREYDKMMRGKQ